MCPYRYLFGKDFDFPVELKYWAFWAIKAFDFDFKQAGSNRGLQLKELYA